MLKTDFFAIFPVFRGVTLSKQLTLLAEEGYQSLKKETKISLKYKINFLKEITQRAIMLGRNVL